MTSYLASLDSTIVVWKSNTKFERVAIFQRDMATLSTGRHMGPGRLLFGLAVNNGGPSAQIISRK